MLKCQKCNKSTKGDEHACIWYIRGNDIMICSDCYMESSQCKQCEGIILWVFPDEDCELCTICNFEKSIICEEDFDDIEEKYNE